MKKNVFKILLDTAMVAVLVTMYNKRAVSMSFHEIGGLALLGVFVVHVLLNWKWVVSVSRRLTDRTLPGKTRLGYWIDALLLICFVLIGVSGALISKVVFSFSGGGMQWKAIHYFCSALVVILLGIHLGLHLRLIGVVWRKLIPLPRKISRPLAVLAAMALLVYGGYSLCTTDFVRWLTMPFQTVEPMHEEDGLVARTGIPETGAEESAQDGNEAAPLSGEGRRQGEGKGLGRGEGKGLGKGNHGGESFEWSTLLKTIFGFFSISFLFAGLTWAVETVVSKRRNGGVPKA